MNKDVMKQRIVTRVWNVSKKKKTNIKKKKDQNL